MLHSTAIISPGADLAEGVKVGPYSIIGNDVQIGAGTEIGSHVIIKGATEIGDNNRILQFASIGEDPQDKKYAGEKTRLVIGDGNTIREHCTLNRGTAQDIGVTRIGNNNWLMAYVHVAHDCDIGNEAVFANNSSLAGHVSVGDYVIFGGFSGVHQFCRVGAHSFIGNNAAVTRDVPPYIMVSGQPAVPRGVNSAGLKRRGFNSDQAKNIKEAFRLLYRLGLRLEEARDRITELAVDRKELRIFAEFLEPSERSIVR
ncbi:MAG: acyl-ACP--UDP-N-acetylglucosamine O-acyltransferase [Pseudomonadota bacterium]|nr:acyl-ACP--UDP-N-acetylglucosamine O-acyltransferase [Pseudomonadota bacterium]